MSRARLSKRKFFEVPPAVDQAACSITVSRADVDHVYRGVRKLVEAGLADDAFDKDDIRLVAQYLLNPANPEPGTWERIKAGGVHGYSLILHEAVEFQEQIRLGVNPMDEADRAVKRSLVRQAHAAALVAEHTWLLKRAHEDTDFATITLGDLIWSNPAGNDRDDYNDVKKKTDVILSTSSQGRDLAAAFFEKIRRAALKRPRKRGTMKP